MIFFCLLVAVMPLLRHSLWGAFIGDLTINKYLGVVCLGYAGLYLMTRNRPVAFLRSSQSRWFVAFSVLAMLSFLFKGPNTPLAVSPFMNYLSFLLLFVTAMIVVDSVDRLRWVALSAIAGLAFASLHLLREWQKAGMTAGYRPGWVTGDPNYFSLSAIIVLPLAYFMLRRKGPRWERLFCQISLALGLVAFVLAASRGGLVALVVMGAFVIWHSKRRARNFAAAAAVLALVGVLAPSSPVTRLLEPARADEGSTNTRLALMRAGVRIFMDNPWMGIGVGNFKQGVSQYGGPEQALKNVAHNTYVEVAAELGLAGSVAFLATFYWSIRGAADVRRRAMLTRQRSLYLIALGLQTGLIGAVVGVFFLSALHVRLLWFAVILSICLPPLLRRVPRRLPEHPTISPMGPLEAQR